MEEETYKLKYSDEYLDHIEKHLKLSGRNEKAKRAEKAGIGRQVGRVGGMRRLGGLGGLGVVSG